MSHYSKIQTKFKNKDALIKALCDCGFTKEQIEIHEEARNLRGYMGDIREQKANIIIRRRYVGRASNDIGFVKLEDGSYEAIISDFDRGGTKMTGRYGTTWINKLTQRYAYQAIKKQADALGYSLEEEERDGKIHLTVNADY